MLKKANYGMNIPQNTPGGFPNTGIPMNTGPLANSPLARAQAMQQQQQQQANVPIENNYDLRSEYMADGGPLASGNPIMDFINNNPEEAQRLLAKQQYAENIPKGNYTQQSYDKSLYGLGEMPSTRKEGKAYKSISDRVQDVKGLLTGEKGHDRTLKTDNVEGLGFAHGGMLPQARRGMSMEELYNNAMSYNDSGEDTYIKNLSAEKNWRNKAKDINMEFGIRPQENRTGPRGGDIISQSSPFAQSLRPQPTAFNYGGKLYGDKPLPKANFGSAMQGVGNFLGSEQGGAVLGAAASLAPMIAGLFKKKPNTEGTENAVEKGPMLDAYGNPITDDPYANKPAPLRAPTYGGFTYGMDTPGGGGGGAARARAVGMPTTTQYANGGLLPEHGFGKKLKEAGRTALDAVTETVGSGMKVLDPLNIGYGTSLSRGMGNLVGEDRYQKGWDQVTDGSQALANGAVKGVAGMIPGVGGLAKQGLNSLDGMADKALSNDDYGMLYKGQDKLKQTVGGVGEIGGAVAGGIFTGNVGGAVGSGLNGFNSFSQGMDMNNDWEGAQKGGGWSTAGNVAGGLSGLASFIPGGSGGGAMGGAMGGMFNNGGNLPSYAGGGIGLPGYMGDRMAEEAAAATNLTPTPKEMPTSMYDPRFQGNKHGIGQNLTGFGPGDQMAYGEMFARGGVLPSYEIGGDTDPPGKKDPDGYKYNLSRKAMTNSDEGVASSSTASVPLDIDESGFNALDELQQKYLASKELVGYEGTDISPAEVNLRSPTYYTDRNAYFDSLKGYGIGDINTTGNTERVTDGVTAGGQDWFGKFNANQEPSLSREPYWDEANAGPLDLQETRAITGYRKDARTGEKVPVYADVQANERGRNVRETDGRKLDQRYNKEGSLKGSDYYDNYRNNGGYTNRYADGGATQGQHPASQYIAEKDEMVYHPNDKPLTLANGGLNQVANNYSKITGDKHNAPSGGVEMAGGADGYIYSDQLKVPKDLYNSLKGLI